jgi:mannose-1-phosphate guanylyltransferase
MHRAEAVAPRQRICTIVAAQHRRWWEGPLWSLPHANIIVQPQNRGTANGILLPLLHILERDPDARVVLLPSDHYVRDETVLSRALRQATSLVGAHVEHILMLGVAPDEVDPELGYILPSYSDKRGALHIAQFVEKPSATLARQLIERGAMWNAFMLVGPARTFVRLMEQRYPEIVMEMRTVVKRDARHPNDAIAAADLYDRLPDLDFSRHVVEGNEAHFRMLPVAPCGWSDLGTPQRVADTLRRVPDDIRPAIPVMAASAYLNLAAQHARSQFAT